MKWDIQHTDLLCCHLHYFLKQLLTNELMFVRLLRLLFFTLSLKWLSIASLTLKLVFKYRVLRHLFCRRISDSACILKVWHRRRTHWSLLMFVFNDFSLPFQNNSEGKKTGALSAAHVSKGCQPLVPWRWLSYATHLLSSTTVKAAISPHLLWVLKASTLTFQCKTLRQIQEEEHRSFFMVHFFGDLL